MQPACSRCNIFGADDFSDQTDRFCSLCQNLAKIMLLDAADSDKGQGTGSYHMIEVAKPNRCTHIVFGLGAENRADPDVIGPDKDSGGSLIGIVGGEAYQFMRADQASHFGHRKIILTDMNTVGIDQLGYIGVVIDNEQDTGLTGEMADGTAFIQHLAKALERSFFPVLDNGNAAFDHLLHHLDVAATR